MVVLCLHRFPGSFSFSNAELHSKKASLLIDVMLARTQLAVMDHNGNVGKEQAKTKEGNDLQLLRSFLPF